MSISLFAAQIGLSGVASQTLLNGANYAITDIYVWQLNSPTPGGGGFWTGYLQTSSGIPFHTVGFLDPTGNNGGSFGLGERCFPDALILPRGSGIIFTCNQFSNIVGVNLMVNISGTVLP